MLFNSLEFIFIFLPISFLFYFYLNKKRLFVGGKVWLVAASLFFYGYWEIMYLPLILGSLAFNFSLGTGLSKTHKNNLSINHKVILTIGIIMNLMLLGYFKYANFFVDNLNLISGSELNVSKILLPLAISFFTFQQIAYLVDSYRGGTSEYDLLNYMLFVTFFPQLIAGPIVHHHEMMSQFKSKWSLVPRNKNILLGVIIFSIGMFKKVVIADTFSVWADSGFSSNENADFIFSWVTSLSYTFQLYFDFSGYCDMAIGAALLFNIRLPINFNSPYKSLDIQDFWRRWHITLGRFLRDYIYIPLGGSKSSNILTYNNLFITFLIGGLWHGASWMFVIWGALHGIALVVHRLWKRMGGNLPNSLAWLVTFIFINTTWVFFRAEDLSVAVNLIKGMLGFNGFSIDAADIATEKLAWLGSYADQLLIFFPGVMVAHVLPISLIILAFLIISNKNSIEVMNATISNTKIFYMAALFVISVYVMVTSSSSVFLYFNF